MARLCEVAWSLTRSSVSQFVFQDCFRSACPAVLTASRAFSSSADGSTPPEENQAGKAEAPSTDAGVQDEEERVKFVFEGKDDFDEDFYPVMIRDEPIGMQGDKRVTRAEKAAAKRAMKGVDRRLQHHMIPVPPEVTVQDVGTRLYFSGPLGSNALDLEIIDNQGLGSFKLERNEDGKITAIHLAGPSKSIMGTARTLLHNKIEGVARGYLVYMQLAGVGFRVSKDSKDVTFPVKS